MQPYWKRYFLLATLVFCVIQTPVSARELFPAHNGALSLGYETLALAADERMGLAGMSFLLHQAVKQDLQAYGGLAAYGAMSGHRGGFFTGGFSAGILLPLRGRLSLDTGLFVGGGGGGAAPQGGGLMLRPHLGLDYQLADWRWGLQWSRVRFPNGAIDSEQISLKLTRPLQFRFAGGWLEQKPAVNPVVAQERSQRSSLRRLSVNQWSYFPRSGTRDTSGTITGTPMRLLGFSIDLELGRKHFLSLQTAGAMAGNADGYAEVLWAYGRSYDLSEQLSWRAALALGAGGGGSVATGGGLLGRATLALDYSLNTSWQTLLILGHVVAPQGDFSADVIGLQLAYHYAVPTENTAAHFNHPQHWRLRGAWQTCRPYGDSHRKGQASVDRRRVDLVGSKIDLMLTPTIYVSGQALGAYAGGAGGYAVGQFGLGWRFPVSGSLHANSELLFGAGGGGGLDVGGGQLVQAMVGLEMELDDRFSLIVSAGEVVAMDGSLRAGVVNVAVGYRLSLPVIRL